MTYPDNTIVDENDNEVGRMQLPDAYRQGKILRVSNVVIINSAGQLLLQLRGPNVMAPGLWQEAALGHVDWGDSYEETAQKELLEEVGVEGLELKEIGYFYKEEVTKYGTAKRFHKIFQGFYDGELKPNDEVADMKWIDLDTLKAQVSQHPEDFTPALGQILELIVPTD